MFPLLWVNFVTPIHLFVRFVNSFYHQSGEEGLLTEEVFLWSYQFNEEGKTGYGKKRKCDAEDNSFDAAHTEV